jgi:hypothetical protein
MGSIIHDRASLAARRLGDSFGEMEAPYRFHPQLLADFVTVEELAYKVLKEL